MKMLKVGCLGLAAQELCVLKGVLTLHPALAGKYTLLNSAEVKNADIVMLNDDCAQTRACWEQLKQSNGQIRGIFLSSQSRAIGTPNMIKRPLQVGKLSALLSDAYLRLASEQTAPVSNTSNAKLHVLVVDDSYPLRKFMEHILPQLYATLRMDLEFAETGEEALAFVQHKKIDLVFLDVVMPGIDGYKTCKKIKAKSNSKVVMLTSKRSPFDKIRGAMSGCDAYLTKPPQEAGLRKAIEMSIAPTSAAKSQAPKNVKFSQRLVSVGND